MKAIFVFTVALASLPPFPHRFHKHPQLNGNTKTLIDLEGTGAWVKVGSHGYTLAGARLEFWEAIQSVVLEELQEWLDRGWQPVGEVGPASVAIRTYRSLGKDCFTVGFAIVMIIVSFGLYLPFAFLQYAEPVEFRVKMRRPKIAAA